MSAVFPMSVGPCGFGIGVSRINLLTKEITLVATPCSIHGESIEVSPDGTFALVIASVEDSGIMRIDLRTGAIERLMESNGIGDLALKPDGSEVMTSSFAPTNLALYIAS